MRIFLASFILKQPLRKVLLLAFVASVSGCGQKGPLYLPTPVKAAQSMLIQDSDTSLVSPNQRGQVTTSFTS